MADPILIIFGVYIGIDNKNKLSFTFLQNIKICGRWRVLVL